MTQRTCHALHEATAALLRAQRLAIAGSPEAARLALLSAAPHLLAAERELRLAEHAAGLEPRLAAALVDAAGEVGR
jgi:hypothetical protein